MIILPWTSAGAEKTLSQISPKLRPLAALQVPGVSTEKARQRFMAQCEEARAAGVPIAVHVRTHWPVETEQDYEGTVTPPEVIAEMLGRFDNIIAVIVAEQYNFTAEQRDYLLRVMKLANERGVYCIFDAGWHSAASWVEFGIDPVLFEAARRCRATFVPMWEMNVSSGMYSEHAELMGLWLSGLCDHWGVNPQTWYWGEAGFGDLGERLGWRCARAGGLSKGMEIRKYFPLYGQMVFLPAMTGASVFWIGGEKPPHAWDEKGNPSHFWRDTLEPAFEFIVDHRVVPDREALEKSVRLTYVNHSGQPYVWDKTIAHSGSRSVRIDNGAGRSIHLSWKTDLPLRPAPGRNYELSGWIKCDNHDGTAWLDAAWFDGKRWAHAETEKVAGNTDWKRVRNELTVPDGISLFRVTLCSEGACGKVWFDDIELKADDGRNILRNPGFEAARPGDARPEGWSPGGGYGTPETDRCAMGINAVWQKAYGITHGAEFLPNNGDFFPIASMPSLACPDAPANPTNLKFVGIHPRKAPVFRVGPCLMAANSHENVDEDQTVSCESGDLRISGVLPVHSYFFIREIPHGWVMFVEGRKDRATELSLDAAGTLEPAFVRGAAEYRRHDSTISLRFSHSQTKAVVVKLTH